MNLLIWSQNKLTLCKISKLQRVNPHLLPHWETPNLSNVQTFWVSSDSEVEKILPWQRDVQESCHSMIHCFLTAGEVLEGEEEKLESNSKYNNYHIIHGFHLYRCMSPVIFSLYDADLKNYLFLKKEHVLVQWSKGAHSRLADNPANRKKTKCQIILKLCTPSEFPESEHSGPNPMLSAVLC